MLDTFKFNSQSAINLCWERRECETSILFSIHKPTDSLMPFLLLFSSEWWLAITLTRYKKLLRKTIKQVVENFATPQEIALPIILSMPHNVVTNNQSCMAGWFFFFKKEHDPERAGTCISNLTLNAKNSLIGRCSHVKNSVVQTSILVNPNKLFSSLHPSSNQSTIIHRMIEVLVLCLLHYFSLVKTYT